MPLPAAPALALTPAQHTELMRITRYSGTPKPLCSAVEWCWVRRRGRRITSWPDNCRPVCRPCCFGVGDLWSTDSSASWKTSPVPADPAPSPWRKRPRSSKLPGAQNLKTLLTGVCAAWPRQQGVSSAAVQRIWKAYHLQPHRVEHFKFSTDPEFVSKVRDIVGLYLNPPDKALVFSVDEKSQIQALDRTQPILPLRPGLPERQTHDYERHGTTTRFAALNVLDGTVIGQCHPRHRHQEFLRFLHRLEASVDPTLAVHIILDNYGTHKHPEVKNWFAAHPRYTSTSPPPSHPG
jgi:hypothetical protein